MLRASPVLLKSKNLICNIRNNIIKSLNHTNCKHISPKIDVKQTSNKFTSGIDLYTNVPGNVQVAIIGGGISPIYASAILKQYPLIKYIHLIDTQNTLCKAVHDLSCIDTTTKIKHYKYEQLNDETLLDVFCDLDIVAIMNDRDFQLGHLLPQDQFLSSCSYVCNTAKILAVICPKALVGIFTKPVTATTPLVYEIFNNFGRCEPEKIIGSAYLETMRIESAAADFLGLNASCMSIPVVGGADPCSSVPLLSRAKPHYTFFDPQEEFLFENYRLADIDSCRSGSNGSVMSTGISAAKFILILAAGLRGCENAVTNAYVKTNVLPVCNYFTSRVVFGRNGVKKVSDMPAASAKEMDLLENSVNIINNCENVAVNLVREQFLNEDTCVNK